MTNGDSSFSIGGALRKGWELTKLNIGFLLIYQVIMYIIIGLTIFFPIFPIDLIVLMLVYMGFCRSALLLTQGQKPGYDQLYTNWRLLLSWFIAYMLFFLLIIVSLVFLLIADKVLPVVIPPMQNIFSTLAVPLFTIAGFSLIWLPLFVWAVFGFFLPFWFIILLVSPLVVLAVGAGLSSPKLSLMETIFFYLASLPLVIAILCFILAVFRFFPFFIVDKGLGPIQSLKKSARVTKGMRWRVLFLFLACAAINLLGILLFFVGVLITVPITLIAIASVYEKIKNQSNHSIQPDDINSTPEP